MTYQEKIYGGYCLLRVIHKSHSLGCKFIHCTNVKAAQTLNSICKNVEAVVIFATLRPVGHAWI